jgi:hypothetical protein
MYFLVYYRRRRRRKMDANKPTDQVLVSAIAAYIRETRAAVNALSTGTGFGTTELDITVGTTSLTVGTDLGRYGVGTVQLEANVAVVIDTILGGTAGQVIVFIALDSNVSLKDGLAAGGALYLNQLPALSNFAMQNGDVIALINIDGDGSAVPGYWRELFRQTALK